jgi:hypothetical protein
VINERTLGLHVAWTIAGFAACLIATVVLQVLDYHMWAVLCGGLGMGWSVRGVPFAAIEYLDAKSQAAGGAR